MRKLIFSFQLMLIIIAGIHSAKAQAPAQCQDVMLQAFFWDSFTESRWTTLQAQSGEISSAFSMVWLPPSGNCQNSFSMGYLPIWWFDHNSAFGTQQELKNLVSAFNGYGTKVIADVVVNHRNGATNWTDFPTEVYNGVTYSMGPAQICSTDEVANEPGQATPTGAPDTGEDFNGGRDLDHTSTIVRNNIKGYMSFLKNEIGYSGWRYDMTKGFSAGYISEYNSSAGAYFSVGEYYDGSYDLCKAWVNGTGNNSTTFDFPLKFRLNAAMWNGGMNLNELVWLMNGSTPQPAGLIHHPDTKRYSVTFVDNHDTYENSSRFTGNVLAAYAFLMGSPGVPCVLLNHWNSNKTAIFQMIAARRAVKLHSESNVTVNQYNTNLYVATATGLAGSLIVKIGSGSYNAPSDYTLATSGTDYAIWIKQTSANAPMIMVTPGGGTYFTPQTVVMSSTVGSNIYYTTDNSNPTNTSTPYTQPLSISTNTTLKAVAYNTAYQQYSPVSTNIYEIESMPSTIKVRFKAPAGWNACKVYSWVGSTPLCGAWPGTSMTLEPDGFYTYTVTGFSNVPIGVVFNNGASSGTQQTVDLFAAENTCWEAGNLVAGKYTANQVTCPSSVGVGSIETLPFRVYPNPGDGRVFIESAKPLKDLQLFDATGRVIGVEMTETGSGWYIGMENLPDGIYLLSFKLDGINKQVKVVKR